MYQQRAPGRAGEPAAVEHRLRLARAEIVPRAVAEDLDPRVVVVAVRPARGVDLPGREADGPQRVDRKGRLLAAPAEARAPHAQRRARPLVCRAVAHLLGAPFVDGQRRLPRGKTRDALAQLRGKKAPAVAKLLLVYARVEHIVQKQPLRQCRGQRRFRPQPQRVRRVCVKEGKIVICPIAERAGGIAPARQRRLLRRKRGEPLLQPLPRLRSCGRVTYRKPPLCLLLLLCGKPHAFPPSPCTICAHARSSSSSVCHSSYSESDGRPIETVCLR